MRAQQLERSRPRAPQLPPGFADECRTENLMLRLSDGRILGYAQYGTTDGEPVFVFHGSPGSRLQVRVAHAPALARRVRILAPDRPGLGLSSRLPGREIADWPEDVRELADALGIARFAVVGISGGGPYAAACAWRLPERVTRAGLVSGVVPGAGRNLASDLRRRGRGLFDLVLNTPWLMRAVFDGGAFPCRLAPDQILARVLALAPAEDQPILRRPAVAAALSASLRESFRQGGQGVGDDLLLLMRPWTVRLQEIEVPVRLWHGEADGVVPLAMGRYFAEAIPRCRAEFIPGGGHYLAFDQIGTVLDSMID